MLLSGSAVAKGLVSLKGLAGTMGTESFGASLELRRFCIALGIGACGGGPIGGGKFPVGGATWPITCPREVIDAPREGRRAGSPVCSPGSCEEKLARDCCFLKDN